MEREKHVISFEGDEAMQSPEFFDKLAQIPRGEPLTWGATPLEISSEIAGQQKMVTTELEKLYTTDIPEGIGVELAAYIHDMGTQRSYRRGDKNHENFGFRQKRDLDGLTIDQLDMYYRALTGKASPAELLHIQRTLGVSSIELATLSHPYGKRMDEFLEPMYAAVDGAIELFKGVKDADSNATTTYEVKGSDRFDHLTSTDTLLMTRERKLATIVFPDTEYGEINSTLVARSSFVLRLDEASGFDPNLAQAIRSVPYPTEQEVMASPYENERELWGRRVSRAGSLRAVVPPLLEHNDFLAAPPISTTIIATSPELQALQTPEHERRCQQEILARAAVRDIGNMATVGVPASIIEAANQKRS